MVVSCGPTIRPPNLRLTLNGLKALFYFNFNSKPKLMELSASSEVTFAQLLNGFPCLNEAEFALTCFQEPATGFCPAPD
jgi:hypothetical protein